MELHLRLLRTSPHARNLVWVSLANRLAGEEERLMSSGGAVDLRLHLEIRL